MIEGKKISQLGTVQTLQDGCCFPVLSRGATKRITFSVLLENIIRRLPDVNQEEIEKIKEKLQELETEINDLIGKDYDIEELIRNVNFQIEGQNLTINQYTATVSELEQKVEQTHFDDVLELEGQVRANTTKINGMYPVIPAEASESNKLTTKSYVDESIQTSSAVNRGNFETYADLMEYEGTVTRNDYATVGDDETHDHEAWRYKWNDDNEEWTPEYRINEAPMTLEQLAALNSGITEELVEQFSGFTNPIDDNAPESTTTTLSAKKINESLGECVKKSETGCVKLASNIYIAQGNTWVTVQVNDNISKYKYLGFSFTDADNDYAQAQANCIIPVDNFKLIGSNKPLNFVSDPHNTSSNRKVSAYYMSDTYIGLKRGSECNQYDRVNVIGYK